MAGPVMRLLAVSPLADVSGGETTLLRALPALGRRGYEVRLAVPSDGMLRSAARARGIRTVRLPLGPPERYTPAALAGLTLAPVHLARTDVVWLNGLSTQRLLPALALTGRPAVLRVNNPLVQAPAWWRRKGYWRIVQAILPPSHATAAECIAAGAPAERVHVLLPPGWEEGRQPPRSVRPPGDAVRVGYVGRIEPRKGVLDLIRAADTFLESHPEATLVVMGDSLPGDPGGYAAQVRSAAASARSRDRIEFRGYVPNAATEMAGLDVLVVPSHAEPRAAVTSEAAAAGVPVVACSVGGLLEAVGDSGVLVPPGDPAALGAAIRGLLDDPVSRSGLAEKALAGADRFDPGRFAESMDELLRAAVSARR